MLTGWEYAKEGKKATPFSELCQALGVSFDLRETELGVLKIQNTEQRVAEHPAQPQVRRRHRALPQNVMSWRSDTPPRTSAHSSICRSRQTWNGSPAQAPVGRRFLSDRFFAMRAVPFCWLPHCLEVGFDHGHEGVDDVQVWLGVKVHESFIPDMEKSSLNLTFSPRCSGNLPYSSSSIFHGPSAQPRYTSARVSKRSVS